ncbi:MAG: D-amino acid dehydrogenase [Alphaproteobacteria bacterium]|nr:D-amino acid dehydrogenase [Alphaproteobacteria bacterium]MBU1515382.1 D-amino acid dehydrogenase [Alphaproteobacteria bacterium]MBU2092983.1 D-amino acid dehydrogenase [Alphaproteobacteria bacterium]MBU2150113.1 D-amino acid dehydrogenase [Alphaproteobacteria bacterium]MBU2309928.1 D-amino acid dehydrogenase [Alphaproteobacteria bacterium]
MKVVVLGSGVIGVTSAYYLAKAGHEVTVVDRQPSPALETSFANAGEVSPGYASPWAAPGIPAKAVKWLMMRHAPLILRPKLDAETLGWMLATLRNCTPARYARNKGRMVRLAEYSRDLLIELRGATGIAYDERSLGTLQLFRTQSQLDGVSKDVKVLADSGVPFQVLDAAGCIAAEPGLAHAREPIVGGLRLPNDETGDCYKFTVALADLVAAMGVTFRFNTKVLGLRQAGGRIAGVTTADGEITADAYVAAMGSYTPALVRPLGLRLPVYPVKGYSITAPILEPARAPGSTLLDESYKVAITRLGDRIRVGGMAEISGFNNTLHPRRRATLEHSLQSLFPDAGDVGAATFWSGLRPMTPDGTPVVGPTALPNFFINAGHGTLGWTMACGSGQVIADVVSGARSPIEISDLAISRYANG